MKREKALKKFDIDSVITNDDIFASANMDMFDEDFEFNSDYPEYPEEMKKPLSLLRRMK